MSHVRVVATIAFWAASTMTAVAQTTPSPSPGPTNPATPGIQSGRGANIVVNPTEDECRRGWNPTMRWTQQQFQEFCTKLGASK